MPPDDPCSFCEYLAGRRAYTILAQDEMTATLVTRQQRGVGHLLVIPVQHRKTLLDLRDDEGTALMVRVQAAVGAIAEVYSAEGVAVWQNNGKPAHQSVPHVHFHVAGTLPEGGTDWGAVPTLSIAETDAIAARLRPAY